MLKSIHQAETRESLNDLCQCGHRNGDHEAAAPHACTGELSDGNCSCRAYRPGKGKRFVRSTP